MTDPTWPNERSLLVEMTLEIVGLIVRPGEGQMTDIENFTGKVALVTGSGQGMGRANRHRARPARGNVAINDINAGHAVTTAADLRALGVETLAVPANVTDQAAVRAMVDAIVEQFGGLHILVNNAEVLRPTRVIDIPEGEWDWVIDVNLKGTFLCSQAALPVIGSRAGGES